MSEEDASKILRYRIQDERKILLHEWKKVHYSGVLNLMKDYNLNWDSVYEILKEAVEK